MSIYLQFDFILLLHLYLHLFDSPISILQSHSKPCNTQWTIHCLFSLIDLLCLVEFHHYLGILSCFEYMIRIVHSELSHSVYKLWIVYDDIINLINLYQLGSDIYSITYHHSSHIMFKTLIRLIIHFQFEYKYWQLL